MGRNFKELTKDFSPERKKRIKRRTAELRKQIEYPGPGQTAHFFTGMSLGFVMGFALGGLFGLLLFH